jgi:cathepsin A (carboxypeptidase C)
VNVGYSYSDSTVNNTPAAAEDVYAFLQLFFSKYSEYASLPFSIAAESYGGHYAPHIAHTIYKGNKALRSKGVASKTQHINLSTVMIGNGMLLPYTSGWHKLMTPF